MLPFDNLIGVDKLRSKLFFGPRLVLLPKREFRWILAREVVSFDLINSRR